MLGEGLTVLAERAALNIEKDWVFGAYNGYDTAIHEGSGYKVGVVYGWFHSQEQIDAINVEMDSHDLKKEFMVNECEVEAEGVHFTYYDKPEKVTDISPFLDWLTELMKLQDVLGTEYCCVCGELLDEDSAWTMIPTSKVLMRMHKKCMKDSKSIDYVERGLKREVKLTEMNDLLKGKSKKKDYSLIFILVVLFISIIYREFIMK